MKKSILLVLLLALLVGCSQTTEKPANETDKKVEEKKETETKEDKKEEKPAEETKETAKEEVKGEIPFVALPLSNELSIVKAENVLQLVNFEAKDNPTLMQGHKYEFNFDPAKITDGKISVDTATMLGKAIPFDVTPEVVKEVLSKVANKVVVDIRSAEEFAKGALEGAINLPEADLENALKDKKPEDLGFKGRETVLVVYGGAESKIPAVAEQLYKVFSPNVVLNAGDYATLAQ